MTARSLTGGSASLRTFKGEIMMPAIDSFLTTWSPRVLSILRIMVGLLFLEHGTSKYLSLPVSPSTGVAPVSLSGINGMIEIVGGVMIVLGLFTRPVAFILAGDMAVAYFIAHAPRGFFPLLNAGELAIIYCFVFLYLASGGRRRVEPRSSAGRQQGIAGRAAYVWRALVSRPGPTRSTVPAGARLAVERVKSSVGRAASVDARAPPMKWA